MSDDNRDQGSEIEDLSGKKITLSLLAKIGSGTILLAVLGYAASWAFVTLDSLQDGVAKNTETLKMIKDNVDRDRENLAQWKRIAGNDRRITDNEVEIRVLKEMLEFYVNHYEGVKNKEDKSQVFGPGKPHKLDKLFDEFIKKKKKKPIDLDNYRNNSMQQMEQMTVPK